MTETATERRNQLWADFIDTVRGAPDPIRALKLRDAIEDEARATAEARVAELRKAARRVDRAFAKFHRDDGESHYDEVIDAIVHLRRVAATKDTEPWIPGHVEVVRIKEGTDRD